jgi:hypothetical protein
MITCVIISCTRAAVWIVEHSSRGHITVCNPHLQLMREAGVVHSGSLSEEVCVHA